MPRLHLTNLAYKIQRVQISQTTSENAVIFRIEYNSSNTFILLMLILMLFVFHILVKLLFLHWKCNKKKNGDWLFDVFSNFEVLLIKLIVLNLLLRIFLIGIWKVFKRSSIYLKTCRNHIHIQKIYYKMYFEGKENTCWVI